MNRVTVVTCTFGRPELLRRAVASVEAQTFRDFTHIIVEDAGNDPSIHSMGFVGPKLVTMEHRTGWPGFICRNQGARLAETDLIAFLDDDNWYDPDHLDRMVDLLDATNSDFVWSSTRLFTKDNELIGYRRIDNPGCGRTDISEILCKRALFIGSGGLDPRDAAPGDGAMVERWMIAGARFAHSDSLTMNYTVSDEMHLKYITQGCILGIEGYDAA